MEIKKENIKIISYLAGFHSFRKDHNYGNFKASLINDIQSLYNENFDSIKVGGSDILKLEKNSIFEIRLTPSTLVYQDNLSFEQITTNAMQMLEFWLKYSHNIKLSLIGLVINFEIEIPKPDNRNHLRIKKQFFKNVKIGKKLKSIDFRFTYSLNYKGHEYNVHLKLNENGGKDYALFGSIDFNSTTENNISGLPNDSCNRIFSAAKEYFETEIIKFINFSE